MVRRSQICQEDGTNQDWLFTFAQWATRSGRHAVGDTQWATESRFQFGFPGETSNTLLARLPDNSVFTFPTTPAWSIKRQWGDHQKATPFPDRILALAFHPNGQQLAAASGIPSRHALIQLLALDSDAPLATLSKAHLDTITSLTYSPDGTRLASASTDRTIKIHSLDPPTLEQTLEGHNHHILALAWSPDASTLASAGADRLYKLWNPESGKETKSQGGFPDHLLPRPQQPTPHRLRPGP